MTLQRVHVERRAVQHHVRVVHGGTGKPFEGFVAGLTAPAWRGWSLRKVGADVVLSALERDLPRRPPATTLEVRIDDPVAAARFPEISPGVHGARTLTPAPADAEVELVLAPDPVGLEIDLVKKTGAAVTGRTGVEARANGHTVALAESAATPGRYAATSAWRPQPYRIFDGPNLRGTVAIDYRRAVTRVRLLVP